MDKKDIELIKKALLEVLDEQESGSVRINKVRNSDAGKETMPRSEANKELKTGSQRVKKKEVIRSETVSLSVSQRDKNEAVSQRDLNKDTWSQRPTKWELIQRGFYENLIFFVLEWIMWILFLFLLGVF